MIVSLLRLGVALLDVGQEARHELYRREALGEPLYAEGHGLGKQLI
jgi:hypothetical protein